MSPRAPRYELKRLSGDVEIGEPEIVPVTGVSGDTVMGRRGALGVGIGAAALLAGMTRVEAQRGRGQAPPPAVPLTRAPYETRHAHRSGITAMLPLGQGDLLASASADNTIKLWTIATGTLAARLLGHTDDVVALAASRDGRWLASASRDQTIRLWSLPDGKPGVVLTGHAGAVRAIAISPDGAMLVSSSDDGTVRLWSLPEGRLFAMLPSGSQTVNHLAISPDGQLLFTLAQSEDTIATWALPSGASRGRSVKLRNFSTAFAWLADPSTIVHGAYDGVVTFQRVNDGAVLRELRGQATQGQGVQSVAVTGAGELIAGAASGSVRVWPAGETTPTATFDVNRPVDRLAISPDRLRLFSGEGTGAIAVWDLEKKGFLRYLEDPLLSERPAPAAIVRAHRLAVNGLQVAADGATLVSVSGDKLGKVWSMPGGQLLVKFAGHTDAVTELALRPESSDVVSGSSDKTVAVWSGATASAPPPPAPTPTPTPTPARNPPRPPAPARNQPATPPRPRVVEQTARLVLRPHADRIVVLAVSPDGRTAVTGGQDGKLALCSLADGAVLGPLDGMDREIRAVAFSPDGTMVCAAAGDRGARIWMTADRRLFAFLVGSAGANAVAWSRDGKVLAVGGQNGQVEFWSTADTRVILSGRYTPRYPDRGGQATITALAFTRDGARAIAGTGNGSLLVFRTSDARLLADVEPHASQVTSLAVTPDDGLVVSAGFDSTLKVVDLAEYRHVATLDGHTLRVSAMAMTPDGRWLASGDDGGVIAIWNLSTRTLHGYLFDAEATDADVKAQSYNIYDQVTGRMITYTLPCGSPIPAGATCTCNCVPGSVAAPARSYGGSGGGTICTCNRVCTCVPIFDQE